MKQFNLPSCVGLLWQVVTTDRTHSHYKPLVAGGYHRQNTQPLLQASCGRWLPQTEHTATTSSLLWQVVTTDRTHSHYFKPELVVPTCCAMTSETHIVCFHIPASSQQVCLLYTLAGTCLLNWESVLRRQRLESAFPRVSFPPDLITNFVLISHFINPNLRFERQEYDWEFRS